MDRCRCKEYAAAARKIRFYTVGTHRPDMIDKYDKTGYQVAWHKHGVDYYDLKFEVPRAHKILSPSELSENQLPKECRKIEQMWCPFMTPVKKG